MTGRQRKLSGGQAFAVAAIFNSGVVGVYYGALVGIAAWYGGHLARKETIEDDRFFE